MASKTIPTLHAREIARSEDILLLAPSCPKGIGSVISSPESDQLIAGVKIGAIALWPDDRGYFLEVQRAGRGLTAGFPLQSTQVSAALSYPGTIKAFHYHLHQSDCWTLAKGMFQVVLADLRAGSPTFGQRNTMYAGILRPLQILIPPGVAHGYKVIGQDAGLLIYTTDRFYNPEDEGRIPYDDAGLNYDWELQHK